MRQHSRDLMEMRQIMNRPGRQQLLGGDGAERRMAPATAEVVNSEIQGA